MRIPSQEEVNIAEYYIMRSLSNQTPLTQEEQTYCQKIIDSGCLAPWSSLVLDYDNACQNVMFQREYGCRPELVLAALAGNGALVASNPLVKSFINDAEILSNLLSGGYYDTFNTLWKIGASEQKNVPRLNVPIAAYRHIDSSIIEAIICAHKTFLSDLIREHIFPDIIWRDSYYAYRAGADSLVAALCFEPIDADIKREKIGMIAALTGRIEMQALYCLDKEGLFLDQIDAARRLYRDPQEAWDLYKKIAGKYGYSMMSEAIAHMECTIALGEKLNLDNNLFSLFDTIPKEEAALIL